MTEEEIYLAEQALLKRQKAILDIIMVLRAKLAAFSTGKGHVSTTLRRVFKKFDEDESGTVNWYEFDRALVHLGVSVSHEELSQLMEIFDVDGNGELRWVEFIDWCDDRKPMTMAKMRRIIASHEGSVHARKTDVEAPPSLAYMKAWLEVHGSATEDHVRAVAAEGARADAALNDSVKLLGGASKIDAALANRKKSRAEVIDRLRAAVVSRTGADVSVKQQLEIIWRRFDVDGNGIISWKEFASGMKSMGLDYSSDELSQIMKEFDTNCDGALDWLEFVGHLMPKADDDVSVEFERLTMTRKTMLKNMGVSRAGAGTPGVRS